MSQPQIIYILEIFKDFSPAKIVVAATHQYSENVKKLFRLQNCRSRKSAISRKYSKTFSAAKLSQQQPIKILEILKDSLACKFVSAANHLYPGNIQRLFRLQTCPGRKSSTSWKFSETFSPANLSQQRAIIILKLFKNISPAKLSQLQISDILETFKDFSACKNVLAAKHLNPGKIQRPFRLQKGLSSNPSIF